MRDARVTRSLLGESGQVTVAEWTTCAEAGREAFAVVTPDSATFHGGVFALAGEGGSHDSVRLERLTVRGQAMPKCPSVILITLDTFRADHLSCASRNAPPTPNLDSLARAGTWFTYAVSTNQATNPSHVSMTGLYCFAHGVTRTAAA